MNETYICADCGRRCYTGTPHMCGPDSLAHVGSFVRLDQLFTPIIENLVTELVRKCDTLRVECAELTLRLDMLGSALDAVIAARSIDIPKGYNGEPGGGEDAPLPHG